MISLNNLAKNSVDQSLKNIIPKVLKDKSENSINSGYENVIETSKNSQSFHRQLTSGVDLKSSQE